MVADIISDNDNNFVIENKDITLKKGEGSKLIALRNYLKRNKKKLIGINEEGLKILILGKCLMLGLDINNLKYEVINNKSKCKAKGRIMPLNSTQQNILNLTTQEIETNVEEQTKAFIKKLSQALGLELTSDNDSNIYILSEHFIKEIINGKLMFLNFLSNLSDFFDTNKFSEYASGNYIGLRSALLDLNFFKDCKIENVNPGVVNIVVLPKEGVKVEEKKQKILEAVHAYLAIGIKTFESKEAGLISGKVNASNGQELEYGFYIAKERKFNMEITYYLDYEDSYMVYDMVEAIKQELQQIYIENYNTIGRNIKIQDFYSLVIKIHGLGKVSIKLDELNEKNEVIKSYLNEDIKITTKEIFILNELVIKGGASE